MSGANRRIDLSRSSSICPSPEELLLESVKKNDIASIENVITANPSLLSFEYSFPYEKSILQIACSEEGIKPETVKVLIDLGADLDGNAEWKPLHLAAQNSNSQILEIVLQQLKPGKINQNLDGNNALHTIVKSEDIKEHEKDFVKHVELLLKAGINVNEGDGKNVSAILWAAQKGLGSIVKTILDNSIAHVDLDSHKLRNKTARQLITEKHLYSFALPGVQQGYDTRDKLFSLVKQSKQDEFIQCFSRISKNDLANSEDDLATLLQYSCEKGLTTAVKFLISKGANVNQVTKNKNKPPIELVSENGYFEIFKTLLDQPETIISTKILCQLIKNLDNPKFDEINHETCLKLLLEKIKDNKWLLDINGEDELKNTPIHYSLRYGDEATTQELLKLGASLASKNKYQTMPIEDIKPEVLEGHLDDCISFNVKSKNYEKQDFEVIFDYRSLVPARKTVDKIKFDESDPENDSFREGVVPETEVISYMSQAPEFKYLLKHPLIVSFLFMKWHRILWLFYSNLVFYVLFVLSLVCYIFTYYGNFGDRSSFCVGLSNLSFTILIVTFIVLVLRETFQISVSPIDYCKNFENLIEVILIILTGMILFIESPSNDTRKQLSSIAILLAAFELVLMVGQHPKLSTNVVMLKTVSVNFFKLLLWYSLLIIAFALSFNILFAKVEVHPSNSTSDDDLFTGPGKSLFKTIVMLTGEFDASSINFQTYPVTSKLIFSLFVFMITIILLNLLNGLAVSDTQTIKNDAELVGHIARAQHIRYVESMLLGNILPTSLLRIWKTFFCCCPCDTETMTYTLLKPLARKVCLFANNNNCQLCVLPNNHGKIFYEFGTNNKIRRESSVICPPCSDGIFLDKETVRRTNVIIKRKREGIEERRDLSIERVWAEQVNLRKKMDEILKILTQSKIEIQ